MADEDVPEAEGTLLMAGTIAADGAPGIGEPCDICITEDERNAERQHRAADVELEQRELDPHQVGEAHLPRIGRFRAHGTHRNTLRPSGELA